MKPRPRLQDMPSLIKRRIADKLDFYVDKMSLRRAYPSFHPIIGDPPLKCKAFHVYFWDCAEIQMWFGAGANSQGKSYKQTADGCCVSTKHQPDRRVKGGDYIELAVQDFEVYVTSANLSIERFHMTLTKPNQRSSLEKSRFLSKIQFILMRGKLKVKHFEVEYSGLSTDILQTLPFLDSEYLESLTLSLPHSKYLREEIIRFNEIVKLSQWKKVEKLKVFHYTGSDLEAWWDHPRTDLRLVNVELEDLKQILEHFRTAPNFVESRIRTKFRCDEAAYLFGGWEAWFNVSDSYYRFLVPATRKKRGLQVRVFNELVVFCRVDETREAENETDEDWSMFATNCCLFTMSLTDGIIDRGATADPIIPFSIHSLTMKPQPRLQDMPSLIKQRITDNLDFYVDKMSLRTACPNFRAIIGDPKARSHVAIRGFKDKIQMSLIIDHHKKQTRNYVRTDKGCKVIIRHQLKWTFVEREIEEQKAKDREIVLENEDYLEVARRDFEMISDNPNLSIDHLTLDKQSDKENLVDLMKYKLKVKGFGVHGFKEGELLRIFSYLDSEVLETFRMEEATEMDLSPILKTWKNLKKLELVDAPLELWWDYPDTEIKLKNLKKEELKRILEHFESAPDFQKSKIYTKISDKDIMDTLGATFHQSNGYQCAQLITDKRTIYLYVKNGIVQFATQPIGYRESYDDEDWELDD